MIFAICTASGYYGQRSRMDVVRFANGYSIQGYLRWQKADVVNAFYEEAARFWDVQANIVEAIRSKNPKYADLRIFGMYTKYADEAAQILC